MKKYISVLIIVFAASLCCAQGDFFTKLSQNLKNFAPEIEIKYFQTNDNGEDLVPQIMILNETYTLSQNSIMSFDRLCKFDDNTKKQLLTAYTQIAFIARNDSATAEIPNELCWLPFAISAFDKHYNQKGNYGYWGLQYLIARKYGLRADNCLDDRLHIQHSTIAALQNIAYNRNNFGNWNLAILAHIYGPTKVRKAMSQSKDFAKIQKLLDPYDNTYDNFLALIAWGRNYETSIISTKSSDFDTITIKDRIHVMQICEVMNIAAPILEAINPTYDCDIIDGRTINRVYNIPIGRKNDFVALYDSIMHYKDTIYFPDLKPKPEPVQTSTACDVSGRKEIIYTIKSGDNLGSIAQKYGVKVSQIQEWNDLSGTNIYAGKKLSIWVKDNSTATTSAPAPKTTTEKPSTTAQNKETGNVYEIYVVKSGDNAYKIAQRYSWATADEILQWNGIKDASKLQIGQKLKIYKKK